MEKYWLGEEYPGIYFTKREAECMVHILQGQTISSIGCMLKLSPRTIEFYLKQMKAKVKCRTKTELTEKILHSDFMTNINSK